MTYLYVLKSSDGKSFKVGITDDVKKRIYDLEKSFTKLEHPECSIYSCNNRKLLNKVENGLHAYLNNHYQSPLQLGGGSTEWFDIGGYPKCMHLISLYQKELLSFKYECKLDEFLQRPQDFDLLFERINQSRDFMEVHRTAVDAINAYLSEHIDHFSFHEENGSFVLKKAIPVTLLLTPPNDYPWFSIRQNAIVFDIQVFNQWKQTGEQKVIKDLVETMFFTRFRLKNLKELFTARENKQQ